mmetsp:Transcript_26947/g.50320  ORF Transcript_26947/g.50320 Transcript_26947/m.50320 type:complete len:381 (-) Transcript_26947:148-1290(-)
MSEFDESKVEDLLAAITAFSTSSEELLEFKDLDKESRQHVHELCDALELYSTSHENGGSGLGTKDIKIVKVPSKFVYSESAIEYFAKMSRTHIPIPDPQYFDYYVETQSPYSNSAEMKALFEQDIVGIFSNSINKMKSHARSVMEAMKKAFQDEAAYQDLLQQRTTTKAIPKLEKLYQPESAGKMFVSIDIRSANYTMLRRHMPVFLSMSWGDLVRRFTESEFLIQSKQFREMVFGNLGVVKRIETMSSQYIQTVVDHLAASCQELRASDRRIVLQSGDEVVYEVNSPATKSVIEAALALDSCPGCPAKELKVTCFSLRRLGTRAHYVRENDTGEVEFKGVSKKVKMQAIKYYQNLPSTELDRMFVDEGELACYVQDYYK